MMEYGILIISGVIGGIIAGMLGLGGGIFYILILPYIMEWAGIPSTHTPAFVIANSLIGIASASGISIISQFTHLRKYWKESLRIGIAATIFSLLTTKYIVYSPWYSEEAFNIMVILLMLYILFQMQMKKNIHHKEENTADEISLKIGSLSGMGAGIVSALSGLGGGIIIIPLLQIRLHQSVKKAKLISLSIIFISSVFISIQNILSEPDFIPKGIANWGFVIPSIAFPIILGVIMGGPLGVKLSNKMNDRLLNHFFSLFVVMVLVEKLFNLFST